MTSSAATMTVVTLFFLGALLTFVVHTDALPMRSLTSEVLDDPEAGSSTDMVLLTLCWDGQAINPQCRRRKTLLRELLYTLLFKSRPAARVYGDTDLDELEEDEPEVKPLRSPSKSKRRENTSGFYSDW